MRIHQMGVLMTREAGADITAEFTDAEDLRELHGALLGTESIEQFLHEMAVQAARLVSGGLSCGMTMQSDGRPVTAACSDPVAARVDEVQYALGDGPCLHAMRDGHMVRIEDTADTARWPEFEARGPRPRGAERPLLSARPPAHRPKPRRLRRRLSRWCCRAGPGLARPGPPGTRRRWEMCPPGDRPR